MITARRVQRHFADGFLAEAGGSLVYRELTRVGVEKVPDDRTMGNLARQLGPEVIEKLHRRVVEIAQENKIATGRRMRVDTTVVETGVHPAGEAQTALAVRREFWGSYRCAGQTGPPKGIANLDCDKLYECHRPGR